MFQKIKNNKKYITLKKVFIVLVPLAFAIYNGVFGFLYDIIWNKAIFIYYLLLFIVKLMLHIGVKTKRNEKLIFVVSFILLIAINISLIIPGILMINHQKPINVGLIPTIAMATYTTYSIAVSIYRIRKNVSSNILLRQLQLVGLINAIVSILTLQNTMIIVVGQLDKKMVMLSVCSTVGLLCLCLFLIMYFFYIAFLKFRKTAVKSKKNV